MKHLVLLPIVLFFFALATLDAQSNSNPKNILGFYPNPAIDYIQIQDDQETVGQVFIFNMTGRKVKEFVYTKGEKCYVADLPKGMYLLQMLDKNQRIISTQKMDKR